MNKYQEALNILKSGYTGSINNKSLQTKVRKIRKGVCGVIER